jgi:hypothetical protein
MSRQLNKKIWKYSICIKTKSKAAWDFDGDDVEVSNINDWLKNNDIKSKAIYRRSYKNDYIEHHFQDEEDALMFKLRWA